MNKLLENRVALEFDDESFALLNLMRAKGGHGTYAPVLGDSLRTLRALQYHASQGFTEVAVRNPVNKERMYLRL
tara:strand:- start:493 stop:714 length:222 start_codon:yes stop_codon:yes gene_type:complete